VRLRDRRLRTRQVEPRGTRRSPVRQNGVTRAQRPWRRPSGRGGYWNPQGGTSSNPPMRAKRRKGVDANREAEACSYLNSRRGWRRLAFAVEDRAARVPWSDSRREPDDSARDAEVLAVDAIVEPNVTLGVRSRANLAAKAPSLSPPYAARCRARLRISIDARNPTFLQTNRNGECPIHAQTSGNGLTESGVKATRK